MMIGSRSRLLPALLLPALILSTGCVVAARTIGGHLEGARICAGQPQVSRSDSLGLRLGLAVCLPLASRRLHCFRGRYNSGEAHVCYLHVGV